MVAVLIGLSVLLVVELVLAALVLGILVLINSSATRLQARSQRPAVHGRDFFRALRHAR